MKISASTLLCSALVAGSYAQSGVAGDVSGLVGYASINGGTTGGQGGATTTVSDLESLRAALEGDTPKVVIVSSMISGDGGAVDVGANTTVYCDAASGMEGSGFRVKAVSNVIIQNCLLSKSPAPTDLIAIEEGATNVWIDHNEFVSDLNAGKDDYDGQLDIKRQSDFITVSYNYFHDSWKTSLVGHSDSFTEDAGHLTVTYHHNRFESINSRAPSFRFGSLHFFNNFLKDVLGSGVNVRMGAKALIESNSFVNAKKAIVTNQNGGEEGFVLERDNLFDNSPIEITQEGAPDIPYTYSPDLVAGVEADVTANAGVGHLSAPDGSAPAPALVIPAPQEDVAQKETSQSIEADVSSSVEEPTQSDIEPTKTDLQKDASETPSSILSEATKAITEHHGAGWWKKYSRSLAAAGSATSYTPSASESPAATIPQNDAEEDSTLSEESEPQATESEVEEAPSATSSSVSTSPEISDKPAPVPAEPATGESSSSEVIGYASENGGTTGGAGGQSTTVSDLASLRAAVEGDSPKIVIVSGMISGDGDTVDVGGSTTVYCEAASGMEGGGFRIKKVSNVIIQNCMLSKSPAPTDLVAIEEGATNVWIDHNEFISDLDAGKDDYDGQLDIKRASDFITVSYNYFHDSWKTSLVGHSDSASEDVGHLTVTYHHNRFESINSRAPSFRFGSLHFYNNLLKDVTTSGVNVRMGAKALVENNVFQNVKKAIVTNLDSKTEGLVVEKGNLFENSETTITQVGAPDIPYSYNAGPASGVEADVVANAGVGHVAAPQ